jgi:fatty acid desaturase
MSASPPKPVGANSATIDGLALSTLNFIPFARSLGVDYLYTEVDDPAKGRRYFVAKASLFLLVLAFAIGAVIALLQGNLTALWALLVLILLLYAINWLWTLFRSFQIYSLRKDAVSNKESLERVMQVRTVITLLEIVGILSISTTVISFFTSTFASARSPK